MMATQEAKGWIWTPEEKQWIKTCEREVRTVYKGLSEQVDRFHSVVPTFADEAAQVAQPFLTTTERLLALADGAARRKYQPLSPDEAKLMLRDVHVHLSTWSTFMHRPDVQDAIQNANRQIDAQKRAQQKQRREVRAQLDQQLKSPEFARLLDGYTDQVFEESARFVALAQGFPFLGPVSTEADRPLLQRLSLVHFIHACTLFSAPVRKALEPYVHRQPTPTLKEVVRYTIAVVIQDHCSHLLSARSGAGQQISIQDVLIVYLQGAFDGLLNSLEAWKKEGSTIRSVSTDYFTILGVDYSLAAQPEAHPDETSALSSEAADALFDSLIE